MWLKAAFRSVPKEKVLFSRIGNYNFNRTHPPRKSEHG